MTWHHVVIMRVVPIRLELFTVSEFPGLFDVGLSGSPVSVVDVIHVSAGVFQTTAALANTARLLVGAKGGPVVVRIESPGAVIALWSDLNIFFWLLASCVVPEAFDHELSLPVGY